MITTAFIAALIATESSGNPRAMGDGGRAHGALQIHRVVVQDVNRFNHAHYRLTDAYSVIEAQAICRLYLAHYATAGLLGHDPTDEDRARIWNGGPDGWKKSSTTGYWHKVQSRLAAKPASPHGGPPAAGLAVLVSAAAGGGKGSNNPPATRNPQALFPR